ncbi:MAG TPA: hypothetical protein VF668_02360 [Pyrinomonadaceae bacterium]|jgi:hypothetical protein
MRICPTCGDFYDDGEPAFCLADGAPLAFVEPRGEVWDEGARVLRQKSEALGRRRRRLKWRRVTTRLTTTLMTVTVVCVTIVNSLIYLAPAPPTEVARDGTPPAPAAAPPARAADPTRTTTPTGGATTTLLPLEPAAAAVPATPGDAGPPATPRTDATPAETTPANGAPDTSQPPPPPPADSATPTPTPVTTQTTPTPVTTQTTPTPTPTPTRRPTQLWTPTWAPAQEPARPAEPAECSDADRRRELQRILAAFGGSWRRGIERERPRVVAEFARVDNAEAALGDIAYEGALSRDCKAASVTLSYVWRVSANANGEPRVVNVPRARRLACARLFGAWVCR